MQKQKSCIETKNLYVVWTFMDCIYRNVSSYKQHCCRRRTAVMWFCALEKLFLGVRDCRLLVLWWFSVGIVLIHIALGITLREMHSFIFLQLLADKLILRIICSHAFFRQVFSSWFIQNNEQCAFVDQFCLDRKSGGTFEKAWKSGGTFSRSSFTLVFCSLVFWGSGQYSQSITNLQSPKFLWNIYYYSIDHD